MSLCGQTPRKEGRARVLSQPPARGKTITAFPGTQGARAEPTSVFSRAESALSIAGSALHESAWLCLWGMAEADPVPTAAPGPPPRPLGPRHVPWSSPFFLPVSHGTPSQCSLRTLPTNAPAKSSQWSLFISDYNSSGLTSFRPKDTASYHTINTQDCRRQGRRSGVGNAKDR